MNESDPRPAMVDHIRAERAWWANLVAEVGADRMNEPGPMGEWTFRDLAAHLLGWRERTIRRLEAAAAGGPTPPSPWPSELDGDDDRVNDWIQEESRDRSVHHVLDDVDRSYERLATAITGLPDDILADPGSLPWLQGVPLDEMDFFSHVHDEHEPAIRAWLAGRA